MLEVVHALWHHGTDATVDLEVGRLPLTHVHLVRGDVVPHYAEAKVTVVVRSHLKREVRGAELHRQDGGGDDEANRVIQRWQQHEDPPPGGIEAGQERAHRTRHRRRHRVAANGKTR